MAAIPAIWLGVCALQQLEVLGIPHYLQRRDIQQKKLNRRLLWNLYAWLALGVLATLALWMVEPDHRFVLGIAIPTAVGIAVVGGFQIPFDKLPLARTWRVVARWAWTLLWAGIIYVLCSQMQGS